VTLVDVITAQGEPTGQTASLNEVNRKGLWRLGVHALIYNSQQEVIIQKRSHQIIYHPDMLDLSVGGG
jgi:isopentenyldiphosphate isomerase